MGGGGFHYIAGSILGQMTYLTVRKYAVFPFCFFEQCFYSDYKSHALEKI